MLQVCVAAGTHQALVASLATALLLLLATAAWAGVVYRKTRALDLKNRSVSPSHLIIHRVAQFNITKLVYGYWRVQSEYLDISC